MTCAGTPPAPARMIVLVACWWSSKEVAVSIIGGLDVHRGQTTFDWIDRDSGEARRGRIAPATRVRLRYWQTALPTCQGAFAVEACTGLRFVTEELRAAGLAAHLAEPAETLALRGPKRRAKTDRTDARLLRDCWSRTGCPSRGSRQRGCWTCAPPCSCPRPWSMSAPTTATLQPSGRPRRSCASSSRTAR